ncbi:phosphonoacetaldehyde reductase [Rhodopirellula sp.]|nr:phosphonoacetaldehyde reductase [Rhodopirellula sp.]
MTVLEGRDSIHSLKSLVTEDWKLLLVRGKTSFETSGARSVIDCQIADHIAGEFFDFDPNPKLRDVEEGIRQFERSKANAILAIGGGSVLDMGKLIALFAAQPKRSATFSPETSVNYLAAFPIIAVPSTSGTGSEVTNFAVMYKDGKKFSICDQSIQPHIAIIDPALTDNLPSYVTACSGLDAFCQAVESIWSTNSNSHSERFAKESLRLTLQWLERAATVGDVDARDGMAKAATLAGRAINITKTTAPHALSYGLTSIFGVPHGHAVAHFIGPLIRFNEQVTAVDCVDRRGVDFVKSKLALIYDALGVKSATQAKARIEAMIECVGLTSKLKKVGVSEESELQMLANQVNLERLANNPRRMSHEDLLSVLHESM